MNKLIANRVNQKVNPAPVYAAEKRPENKILPDHMGAGIAGIKAILEARAVGLNAELESIYEQLNQLANIQFQQAPQTTPSPVHQVAILQTEIVIPENFVLSDD